MEANDTRTVKASLECMVACVSALIERDASYHGAEIRLPMASHGEAIGVMRHAREALNKARAALRECQPDTTP